MKKFSDMIKFCYQEIDDISQRIVAGLLDVQVIEFKLYIETLLNLLSIKNIRTQRYLPKKGNN